MCLTSDAKIMQVQPSDWRKLTKIFPAVPLRLRAATLILLGISGCFGAIAMAWFGQNPFFVPLVSIYTILAPTVILLIVAQAVMKTSPQPRTWSKVLVVGMLLALTLRYILWRSQSTLNLADPLNGSLSLGLFIAELLFIFSNSLQLYLMLKAKPRHREADRHSIAVLQGKYTPTVDILIPTYNEPEFILRRTIIGCQALQYSSKKIYLLDDKRRPEMRSLATELGCEYITRPDNRHAKAGNLNHALARTSGEFIVVF